MPHRILYLHTGTHKTGSTALQAWFVANAAGFSRAGVAYALPAVSEQTVGNGGPLYDVLSSEMTDLAAIVAQVEALFGESNRALCSYEDFTRLRPHHWKRLARACDTALVSVRSITFVRDVAPYYRSLHAQLVRAGETIHDFQEFCESDAYSEVLQSIRGLAEAFGRESMTVLRYESHKKALDAALCRVVGIDAAGFDRSLLEKPINRSLHPFEQSLVISTTRKTSGSEAAALAAYLVHRRRELASDSPIAPAILEMLSTRHASDLEWLNASFIEDDAPLRVDTPGARDTGPLPAELERAITSDAFEWALTRMNTDRLGATNHLLGCIGRIDWSLRDHPAIPESFDPICYLLLNDDVLRNSAAPHAHFIQYGQYETHRKYRLVDLAGPKAVRLAELQQTRPQESREGERL